MLTKNINFKNFSINSKSSKILKDLHLLLKQNLKILEPLQISFKYNYSKKLILKLKKFSNIRIIGMGGSILGIEAIHDFLIHKINKKLTFVNNLNSSANYFKDKKKILI